MPFENLELWDALSKTNPKHTKKFKRPGGFSGTSVKPIYMVRAMTERFGPCGKGWGMTKPEFQIVPGADGETLAYCTVGVWHGARDNLVYGVGGDKAVVKMSNRMFSDDEAFKKSYTDAMSNAMKQIGMAADIHMGQHDDDKYVRELQEEFRETPPKPGDGVRAAANGHDKWEARSLAIQADLRACTEMDQLITYWPTVQPELLQMKEHYRAGFDAVNGAKAAMKTNLTDPAEQAEREAIQTENERTA